MRQKMTLVGGEASTQKYKKNCRRAEQSCEWEMSCSGPAENHRVKLRNLGGLL